MGFRYALLILALLLLGWNCSLALRLDNLLYITLILMTLPAFLSGLVLGPYFLFKRRMPPWPFLVIWLTLWAPLLLRGQQSFFVDRRVRQIGVERLKSDARVLLESGRVEAAKLAPGRDGLFIGQRDPRVGASLRELGSLIIGPIHSDDAALAIRMGGLMDEREYLWIKPDDMAPGLRDRSTDGESGEGITVVRRQVAPGLIWESVSMP